MESPRGFSSRENKDENGAWIVNSNWERAGTRSTEEYKKSACEECQVWLEDFMCNICSDSSASFCAVIRCKETTRGDWES
jgi:hypothetical protein